jgi:hypothetical protein
MKWLRLLLEIGMAATIVFLLVFKPLVVGRETLRRTPVPRCTLTTFPDYPSSPTAAADHLHLPSSPEDLHLSQRS